MLLSFMPAYGAFAEKIKWWEMFVLNWKSAWNKKAEIWCLGFTTARALDCDLGQVPLTPSASAVKITILNLSLYRRKEPKNKVLSHFPSSTGQNSFLLSNSLLLHRRRFDSASWETAVRWYLVGASQVALVVKNLPAFAEDVRDSSLIPGLGRALEMGMATHSSILAWRIPWTEEPGGLQSTGSQSIGHEWSDLAPMVPGENLLLRPWSVVAGLCLQWEFSRRPEI